MKGIVVKSTGSWYSVMDDQGNYFNCRIKGIFRIKGIKSTNPLAVGDKVDFEIDDTKEQIGIISNIEPRKNYIIRKSINLSKQTHILAANVDQALLIATLVMPRTSTGFIDRFLVTAEAYEIPVTILFNKSDLIEGELKEMQQDLMNVYQEIGYKCLEISSFKEADAEMVRQMLKDKISLISGHSGVGKTTLINAIQPGLNLKTGDISATHFKGKHTTTFAEMVPLSFGGFIIDTPGIKEIGLIDIKKEELAHYYPEFRRNMHNCKFKNCHHINEPKCGIKDAVENGEISGSRYNSYLSIYNSEEMEEEY
jgi:ribosome biogenesis GTPase / thiamine phosphate phosphatase